MADLRVRARDFLPKKETVDPQKIADKSVPDDQLTAMERRLRNSEDQLARIEEIVAKKPPLVDYEFTVNRGKNDRITSIDAVAKPVVTTLGRSAPRGRMN